MKQIVFEIKVNLYIHNYFYKNFLIFLRKCPKALLFPHQHFKKILKKLEKKKLDLIILFLKYSFLWIWNAGAIHLPQSHLWPDNLTVPNFAMHFLLGQFNLNSSFFSNMTHSGLSRYIELHKVYWHLNLNIRFFLNLNLYYFLSSSLMHNISWGENNRPTFTKR